MLIPEKRSADGLATFFPAIPCPECRVLGVTSDKLPLLENSELASEGGSGGDTWPSDKPGGDGVDDGPIEVGHDHDVELLGGLGELHARVIDDHLLVLDGGVLLADLPAALEEEPVGKLHDVGLVHNGHLLSSGEEGVLEGVLGESDGSVSGDNLETLEDAWVDLVLDSGVLSLEVISDDDEVAVLVSGVETRHVEGVDDWSVNLEAYC